MVKRIGFVVLLIAAVCLMGGIVMAADEAAPVVAAPVVADGVQVVAPTTIGNKVCPVTGEVIKELGKDTVEYDGKIYNMCCPMCKDEFMKDPAKYVAKVNEEVAKVAEAVPAETAKTMVSK